jgi:hypothetical protein
MEPIPVAAGSPWENEYVKSFPLRETAPSVFESIPTTVWQRKWISFCEYNDRGNDVVPTYLSRYIFQTAISNTRIFDMSKTHVTFRRKDRNNTMWR